MFFKFSRGKSIREIFIIWFRVWLCKIVWTILLFGISIDLKQITSWDSIIFHDLLSIYQQYSLTYLRNPATKICTACMNQFTSCVKMFNQLGWLYNFATPWTEPDHPGNKCLILFWISPYLSHNNSTLNLMDLENWQYSILTLLNCLHSWSLILVDPKILKIMWDFSGVLTATRLSNNIMVSHIAHKPQYDY